MSVCMIQGALIKAVVFGEIKSIAFKEILDTANTAMKNMKLPEQLQLYIYDYLIYTRNTMDFQEEVVKFQQKISPSLRKKVNNCIYKKIITKNELFQENKGLQNWIVNKLQNLFCKPEEILIEMGDCKADCMFIIAKGDCRVYVQDEFKENKFVQRIRAGSYFGEIALIFQTIRTATVMASNYLTVAKLPLQQFQELKIQFPQLIQQLKSNTVKYQDA